MPCAPLRDRGRRALSDDASFAPLRCQCCIVSRSPSCDGWLRLMKRPNWEARVSGLTRASAELAYRKIVELSGVRVLEAEAVFERRRGVQLTAALQGSQATPIPIPKTAGSMA